MNDFEFRKSFFKRFVAFIQRNAVAIVVTLLLVDVFAFFSALYEFQVNTVIMYYVDRNRGSIFMKAHHILHNKYVYLKNHALLSPEPQNSPLEKIEIVIGKEAQYDLEKVWAFNDRASNQDAHVIYNDKIFDAKVRYRGTGHWHRVGKQKSWRIELDKGHSILGKQSFDLINPKELLPYSEIVSHYVARQFGLHALTLIPVELYVNGVYSGFSIFQQTLDQDFLTDNGLNTEGSILGIDLEVLPVNETTVSRAWFEPQLWIKLKGPTQDSRREEVLNELSKALKGNVQKFEAFAKKHFNLQQFSRALALDSLFGVSHRSSMHNIRYFYDPKSEQIQPLPWDFSTWADSGKLDIGENIILTSWKASPYLEMHRQKAMWDLVTTVLDDHKIENEMDRLAELIKPAILADKNLDAMSAGNGLRNVTYSLVYNIEPKDVIRYGETSKNILQRRKQVLEKYVSADESGIISVKEKNGVKWAWVQKSAVPTEHYKTEITFANGTKKILYEKTIYFSSIKTTDIVVPLASGPMNQRLYSYKHTYFPNFTSGEQISSIQLFRRNAITGEEREPLVIKPNPAGKNIYDKILASAEIGKFRIRDGKIIDER